MRIYSYIGKLSGIYNLFLSLSGYESSVKRFLKELPFNKNSEIKVLDAGCGTGVYTLAILEQYPGAKVVAFDLSPEIAQALKQNLLDQGLSERAEVFSGNINGSLNELGSKKFDLIVTSGVLEYVPLEKAVTKLSGFLNQGGYFLNSPVKDTVWGKFISWIYSCKPYTQERNIKAFENNGFILIKTLSLPFYIPASFKEMHLFRLK